MKKIVYRVRKGPVIATLFVVILLAVFAVAWILPGKKTADDNENKYAVVSVAATKPTETMETEAITEETISQETTSEEVQEENITVTEYVASGNSGEDFVGNNLTGTTSVSGDKEYVYGDSYFNQSAVTSNAARIDASPLLQLPELPTGCEITSLTSVLNYLGYSVSKGTMADYYLPKCNPGEGSFRDYFIGNPRDGNSFGCFADPIVTAANSYISQNGGEYQAKNISGSDFSTILNYVADGTPVIVWGTMYMEQAYLTAAWYVNGEEIRWIAQEHCMVLIGYDLSSWTVTVSDPLQGIVNYDLSLFIERHKEMLSQAVVIEKQTTADAKLSENKKEYLIEP